MAAKQGILMALRAVFPADIAGVILPYTAHTDTERVRMCVAMLREVEFDATHFRILVRERVIVGGTYTPARCMWCNEVGSVVFVQAPNDVYDVYIVDFMQRSGPFAHSADNLAELARIGVKWLAEFDNAGILGMW